MSCANIRLIPYLVSQYLWVGVLALCLCCLITHPESSMTKEFKSSKAKSPYDLNKSIHWFVHTSDTHMTVGKSQSVPNLVKRLKKVGQLLPEKVIMTGDIVDSYDNSTFTYRRQEKNDWILFPSIISNLKMKNEDILVYPGNHDVSTISSSSSEANYGSHYFWDEKNYSFSRLNLTNEVSIFHFNPYEFPTPNAYILWWTQPRSQFKKKLSTLIKEVGTDQIQFLTTHSATLLWFPRSYIHDAILNAPNARIILTGHFHPKNPLYLHHGDTLEIVGQPLFRDNAVGLITVDNSRVSYHKCNLTTFDRAFFTNPSPREQSSSYEVFNELGTHLRAIAFAAKKPVLEVVGDYSAKLECRAIPNKTGVWDCYDPAPLKLEFGEYQISVKNSTTVLETINFTLGETIKPFRENHYCIEKSSEYVALFYLYWLVLFLIVFPIGFGVPAAERWIEGESGKIFWLQSFLGIHLFKARVQKLSLWYRICLFVCVIWAFMPLFFAKSDGKLEFYWFYGFGGHLEHFYGYKYALAYVEFTLVPAVLMASSIGATSFNHWISIFDGALFLLAFWGVYSQSKQMAKENGPQYAWSGPGNCVIYFILLVLTVVAGIFQKRKDSDLQQYSKASSSLLDP